MASREAPPAGIRIGKWAGSFVGPSVWFGHQQILSALIHAECPPGVSGLVILSGAVCALIAAAGAFVSWRARERRGEAGTPAMVDRFVATLSVSLAAISVLAIVFASTAGSVLQCQR